MTQSLSTLGTPMNNQQRLQILIEQLADTESSVRAKARTELFNMGEVAIPPLIEVMQVQQGKASWEAAKVLAEFNDPRCLAIMKVMLIQGNAIIAQTAVNALKNYNPPNLVAIFISALPDAHQVVKLKIIESIGELNQEIDPTPLIDLFATTDSASIRYTIIDTLIQLNIQGDYDLIITFADDSDRHVQARVQRYIKHFSGSK